MYIQMSGSFYSLNAQYNTLLAILEDINQDKLAQDLENVLTEGNDAAGLNMTNVGAITVGTLNYTTLNPAVPEVIGNISQVLAVGNDATNQSITNMGSVALKAGGGGSITYADGTVQSTAYTGSAGGDQTIQQVLAEGSDAGGQQISNILGLSTGSVATNPNNALTLLSLNGNDINLTALNSNSFSSGQVFISTQENGGPQNSWYFTNNGNFDLPQGGGINYPSGSGLDEFAGQLDLTAVGADLNLNATGVGGINLNSATTTLSGTLTFPDASVQTTAFTGSASTPSLSQVLAVDNSAEPYNITKLSSIAGDTYFLGDSGGGSDDTQLFNTEGGNIIIKTGDGITPPTTTLNINNTEVSVYNALTLVGTNIPLEFSDGTIQTTAYTGDGTDTLGVVLNNGNIATQDIYMNNKNLTFVNNLQFGQNPGLLMGLNSNTLYVSQLASNPSVNNMVSYDPATGLFTYCPSAYQPGSINIGENSGQGSAGTQSVHIGGASGGTSGDGSVGIGVNSGVQQGIQSVAVGAGSGFKIGAFCVSVGANAGGNLGGNSICLNATGLGLNPANQGLYIDPIRNQTPGPSAYNLFWDTGTKEVFYDTINATGLASTLTASNDAGGLNMTNLGNLSSSNWTMGAFPNSSPDTYITNQNTQGALFLNMTGSGGEVETLTLDYKSANFGVDVNMNGNFIEAISSLVANDVDIIYTDGAENITGTGVVLLGTGMGTIGNYAVGMGTNVTGGDGTLSANAVGIGFNAGYYGIGQSSVAIGQGAGSQPSMSSQTGQGTQSVAIGLNAGAAGIGTGGGGQGGDCIAIGAGSGAGNGNSGQISGAVAIGSGAGGFGMNANSVAIGYAAGKGTLASVPQGQNSIAIGPAAGAGFGSAGVPANSFVVSSMRSAASATNQLTYNTTTKEIQYAPTSGTATPINFSINASGAPYFLKPSFGSNVSGNKCKQNLSILSWATPTSTYSQIIQIDYSLSINVGGGSGNALSFNPIFYDKGSIFINPQYLTSSFSSYTGFPANAILFVNRTLTSQGNNGQNFGTGLVNYYTSFIGQIYLEYTAGETELLIYYNNTNQTGRIAVPVDAPSSPAYRQADNRCNFSASLVNSGSFSPATTLVENTAQTITQ